MFFRRNPNNSVAADRYKKNLHEKDTERAASHYIHAGLAGAALGLALRKPGVLHKTAAGYGALAGVGVQAATRIATGTTKDRFGDRSPGAKQVDRIPTAALAGAALLAGHRRLKAKLSAGVSKVKGVAGAVKKTFLPAKPAGTVRFAVNPGEALRWVKANKGALVKGTALAGGIAGADALTSGILPEKDKTRTEAASGGLLRGAIYGTGLAVAEPFLSGRIAKWSGATLRDLKKALGALTPGVIALSSIPALRLGESANAAKRLWLRKARRSSVEGLRKVGNVSIRDMVAPQKFAVIDQIVTKDGRTIAFGGADQLRDARGRTANPMAVAGGETTGFYYRPGANGKPVRHTANVGVLHGQVLRAAYNKGAKIHKYGGRAHGLISDAASAARGEKPEGNRKREWQKAWFKRAAGAAIVGAGLLGHTATMKKFPKYRANVVGTKNYVKRKVNAVIPDAFSDAKLSVRIVQPGDPLYARGVREIRFEEDRTRKNIVAGTLAAGSLGGIGVVTHQGVKAIGSLQKRGTAVLNRLHATIGKPSPNSTLNSVLKKSDMAAQNISSAAGHASAVAGGVRHAGGAFKRGLSRLVRPWKWFAQPVRELRFDWTAPEWDVRDGRGRSARVFAPGARARERREKKWHEKIGNIRKIAVAGAVATGVAGLAGGFILGKRAGNRGLRVVARKPGAVPMPVRKPKARNKQVIVPTDTTNVHAMPVNMPFRASAKPVGVVNFGLLRKSEDGPSVLAPLAGVGAGLATYAALRRKTPLAAGASPQLRAIRKAAETGGFARVRIAAAKKPTLVQKLVSRVTTPADTHVHIGTMQSYTPGKKFKGAIFDPEGTGALSGTTIGAHNKTSRQISRGKLEEYTEATRAGLKMPHTAPLGDASTLPSNYVAKMARGSQSKFVVTKKMIGQHDPAHPLLKSFKTFRKTAKKIAGVNERSVAINSHPGYKRWLTEQAVTRPDRFVRQKRIDIAKEYRVHTIGGKAMGITSGRFKHTGGSRAAEKAAEAALKGVKPALRDNLLGMDMAKDRRGKWHVIESNPGPESGFLTPQNKADIRGPHQLYKVVTGRHARVTSAAGGLAAGSAAGFIAHKAGNQRDGASVNPKKFGPR